MEAKNIIEIKNKKTEYQYFLMDSYTAGLVLTGTEIKSIREGRANLTDAYCAFIDKSGRIVIPCQWKEAGSFCKSLAAVADSNDKAGYIDKSGQVVIPCQWEGALKFSENGTTLVNINDNTDKWVYIDKTGRGVALWQIE